MIKSQNRPARRTALPMGETLEGRRLLSGDLAGSFLHVAANSSSDRVDLRVTANSTLPRSDLLTAGLYASTSPTLDSNATLLTGLTQTARSNAGRGTTFHFRFSAPSTLPDGTYFLIARIDAPTSDGGTTETIVDAPSTFNAQLGFTNLSGQIVRAPSNPLFVDASNAGDGSVRVRITNNGTAAPAGSVAVNLYAGASTSFDPSDILIGTAQVLPSGLRAHRSRSVLVRFEVPAGTVAGPYHLFASITPSDGIPGSTQQTVAISPALLTITDMAPKPLEHRHHHNQADDNTTVAVVDTLVIGAGSSLDGFCNAPIDTTLTDSTTIETPPSPDTSQPSTLSDPGSSSDSGGSSDFGSSGGVNSSGDTGGGFDF